MRTSGVVLFTALIALPLVNCASAPRYAKEVSTPSGAVLVKLESVGDMSEEQMRVALLTEAAHETIDRGSLFLRVDELTTDSDTVVRQRTDAAAPRTISESRPSPSDRTVKTSEVSLSRHRHGTVRFAVSRERPTSGQVYDASRLLDELRAGRTLAP